MHTEVLISINHRTKFEMPSLTQSKDMTGSPKFKNGSRNPDHAY